MFCMDGLIALAQIGLGEKVQEFVRTAAADDPVGVKAMPCGNRLAERAGGAVRVKREIVGVCAIGLDRLHARAERRFIRREPEDLGHTLHMMTARHIGINVHHARPGERPRFIPFRFRLDHVRGHCRRLVHG